jgi:voltage-gated potassium channel Kch
MGAIYATARAFRAPHREALERMVLMAQGGEFAFVLYGAALAVGLIDGPGNAVLTAIIILSMALTPLMVLAHDRLLPAPGASTDGMQAPDDLRGAVLLIGFGRFGQVVSQPLLARGHAVSIIDTDPDMIRVATRLGFKVYFGDGARLDILHAAGAGQAQAIVLAIDNAETATHIATLIKAEFPLVPVFARAWDRAHALKLIRAGADFQLRELFESALAVSRHTLVHLGETDEAADEAIRDARARDAERLALQMTGDLMSGRELLLSNLPDKAS